MELTFDYDPEKSRGNREKHGIDFLEAQQLWPADHIVIPARTVRGENRFAILGTIDGSLYVAVFALRPPVIRLISCHRADDRLKRIYEARIHEKKKS